MTDLYALVGRLPYVEVFALAGPRLGSRASRCSAAHAPSTRQTAIFAVENMDMVLLLAEGRSGARPEGALTTDDQEARSDLEAIR